MNEDIRALCREHDRLIAEAEIRGDWTPPQEKSPAPMRQKAAPVATHTYDHSDVPASVSLDEPTLVAAIGAALARERKLAREARAKELAPLQAEIAELRGQVKALLALLGSKEDKVVDVPSWRRSA
jgi:hypothetical protein